jgi:ubiquinone/menaquinone biosynthesis C-methylase UbiE
MAAESPALPTRDRQYYTLVERTADVALAAAPVPLRVLVVNAATGDLLRELIERVPYGAEYVGVDPSAEAVRIARAESDGRGAFLCAQPEALPFPDAHFDLVVSNLAHRRLPDATPVLHQMARVLKDAGHLVVVGQAKPKQMIELIEQTGLRVDRVETVRRSALRRPRVRAYVAAA